MKQRVTNLFFSTKSVAQNQFDSDGSMARFTFVWVRVFDTMNCEGIYLAIYQHYRNRHVHSENGWRGKPFKLNEVSVMGDDDDDDDNYNTEFQTGSKFNSV